MEALAGRNAFGEPESRKALPVTELLLNHVVSEPGTETPRPVRLRYHCYIRSIRWWRDCIEHSNSVLLTV